MSRSEDSPRAATAAVIAILVVIATTIFDFRTSVGVGVAVVDLVALLAAAWTRSRRFVASLCCAIVVLLYARVLFGSSADVESPLALLLSRTLLTGTAVALAAGLSYWLGAASALEATSAEFGSQNAALEAANRELSAREEEIARQNEELQSQSEELERQSEELRIANDDLATRERILARLLALSRALAGELTSEEVMRVVCESLADLLGEHAEASALLLREGNTVRAHCHFGFGTDGPASQEIPYESSFAALLMSRGQAGFLQDVSRRPDVSILAPREGRFLSVVGAPITSRGRLIGTIEVYNRRPTAWEDEQVTLITSMAAQASLSLETARLFEEVMQAKRRFETVFRTLPLAVLACDDDGCRHVVGNPAAGTLFTAPIDANFSPFSPLGARIQAMFHRGGRPVSAEASAIVRAVRGGEEIHGEEHEIVFPGGRRATILASAVPFYDGDGKITGGVCVLYDVTRQKELERDLDARRRESEEANLRKTRFLAAVSHDIRTPANVIRLQAELIKRTVSEPSLAARLPDLVRTLERNTISLVELVGDVLDITRFDSGKIELQEIEFSLGGKTALRLLDESSPEVILLDLMLPDLDGFEILKVIHANRPRSLRGVIVLTGDLASRSRHEIELLGAALVLDKPVEPADLVRSIRRLLERSQV